MTTSKDYMFVRREFFTSIIAHKDGNFVLTSVDCPQCGRHRHANVYRTETGSLNGAVMTLEYIECASCHIHLYPSGGSFTMTRDPLYVREWAEHDKMAAKLAVWWRNKDKRTPKEKRRIDKAVERKMSDFGPVFTARAQPIVKSLRAPYIAPDGSFQPPRICTLLDVAKIDDLPAKIVDVVNGDPHAPIEMAWERSCAQPPHALGVNRYNK